MAHDVFVSHSTKDKLAADAVVAHLEQDGLRCWCAPRDIQAGTSWANAIVQAITGSKVMVVVFSSNANESDHIRREVERAVSHGIPVVPVRIEDVMPQGDLEYFLSSSHWMDAISKPMERHFDSLAAKLKGFVDVEPKGKSETPLPRARTEGRRSSTSKWPIIAAGVVVVGLLGIGGYYLLHGAKSAQAIAKKTIDESEKATPPLPPDSPPRPQPIPIVPPEPRRSGKSALVPMKLPASITKLGNVGVSIAQDNAIFQAIALIKWENSFFLDNGPTRFTEWKRAADAGDATAAFFVGYCYAQGAGVTADDVVANTWFQKSIDGGNSDALAALGLRNSLGLGTAANPFVWYQLESRAAAAKNAGGMSFLGAGLVLGGVPGDREKGLSFLRDADAAGSIDGRMFLAFQKGNPPATLLEEMAKLADMHQPDALLLIANFAPSDQKKLGAALEGMNWIATPVAFQNLIDPPVPLPFNTSGIFTKPAWQRLHAMADAGYVEAQRTIDRLKQKGIVDPVVP